jgi:ATP-dependent RNA helicase RhlE
MKGTKPFAVHSLDKTNARKSNFFSTFALKNMNFNDFGLHDDILDGIEVMRYPAPTPIQAAAIPLILAGKDLIGTAQTGTGKTAAFVLPLLHQIIESGVYDCIQALIIVPTRELAVQIDQAIEAYSYYTKVTSIAIYGGGDGKEFAREKNALSSGVDIVVATPGRLIAHMNMGYVDFSKLRHFVLDEADRMLDMGFLPDLNKIIDKLNPQRQNLLFSATMPTAVLKLTKKILNDPAMVKIALSKPAEGVSQGVYLVTEAQKMSLMTYLLAQDKGKRVIVFGSTKRAVGTLFQRLQAKRLQVGMISSDVEQQVREQILLDYRTGKIDILVATDVLSRGIDVDGIEIVVNFDVPHDAEDYVHRIGRTARAGRTGSAITLVTPADLRKFRRIESLIGKEVPRLDAPAQIGPTPDWNGKFSEAPRPKSGNGPRGRSQSKSSAKPPQKSSAPAASTRPESTPAHNETETTPQQQAQKKKKQPWWKKKKPNNNGDPNQ